MKKKQFQLGSDEYSDSWASWSPDGEWIALVRRVVVDGRPERGNHIWIMSADGGDARQLTAEPDLLHFQPHWSPDGQYLLFHQYTLGEPLVKPTIWILDVPKGKLTQVTADGSQPAWLP